jgi:hypothetical protein
VEPQPLQYVKICSLYGAGFYYMPGTDTCLKVGGYVRAEVNVNAGGSYAVPATLNLNDRNAFVQDWRVRAAITLDARSQTEYGTLRSYLFIAATDDESGSSASGNPAPANLTGASGYNRIYAPTAFIQFAGFTAGKTGSFFDFDGQPYSNQSNVWSSNNGGNGVELFAYTAQFGNGLSASIAAENASGHRMGVTGNGTAYAQPQWPDVVGNLRIDQAWGSAQVMAAAHQVIAQDVGGISNHPSDKVGWALGAGLRLNAPMLGKGDYVIAQFTYAEGAMDYVGSGLPATQTVTSGFPFSSVAQGQTWDAVWTGTVGGTGGGLELTKGWSITGGYEHFWNAQWKSSLYGSYGKIDYSDTASAVIAPAGTTAGSSADWSLWQIGSRTVWTPVTNLDLSVDVMYNKMNSGFTGTIGGVAIGNQDWVSGMFRVQRNFYP